MGEMMQTAMIGRSLDRIPLARIAQGLAIAAVVSLPWSTSLTAILTVLWLLALIPVLDFASVRQILATPAGALPVALWAFALIGVLWSIAPPGELFGGFQAYARFLVIPLLLTQFRKSGRVDWVLGGFLISCIVLLIASFVLKAWPWLWWRTLPAPGIPVKDYVVQSGEFLLCAFGLAHWAIDAWGQNRRGRALAPAALALAFLVNIIFIATSRAAFVVFVVMVGLLAFQRFSRKGALAVMVAGAVLAGVAWVSSPRLRERVMEVSQDVELYENGSAATSSGYRLNWWKHSLGFIASAPLIGHGTGSTRAVFRQAAVTDPSLQGDAITDNPHNQTLSIAIQLGLLGAGVLWAMWIAHLLLFRGEGLAAWIGAGVVVENVVASLFNSQLFYFSPGWIYIFGVGVLGGVMLRGAPGWRRGANAANE